MTFDPKRMPNDANRSKEELIRELNYLRTQLTTEKQLFIEELARLKRSEKELRVKLEQAEGKRRILNAMMEHIPLGITIADAPDVRIRAVSHFGRELIGKTRDQIEGIAVEEHAEKWQVYRADGITPATNEELWSGLSGG